MFIKTSELNMLGFMIPLIFARTRGSNPRQYILMDFDVKHLEPYGKFYNLQESVRSQDQHFTSQNAVTNSVISTVLFLLEMSPLNTPKLYI